MPLNKPSPPQKTETTVRNKVMWQKNILPGGRVDWVIVGFSAPVSVDKTVKAVIGISEISEKKNEGSQVITATVPFTLEDAVKKDVLDLIVGEESKEVVAKAVEEQEAIIRKIGTKEISVDKKEARLEHEGAAMSSEETHKSYESIGEAMVVLAKGAKPKPLKELRERSVGEIPLTAAEIFKPSKWLSQANPAASCNLPIAAESSEGPVLRRQSNQDSRTTSPKPTSKRARSSPQSRSTSPKSPPSKKPHPAEVIKSFCHSKNTNLNYSKPRHSPFSNTQSSQTRLTSSDSPKINGTLATRPKKSACVASRMIIHALGLRAIPRVREAKVESK
ncbi:hypothetical protein NHQ30_006080 [Ciborinia camelliae]|nr:hypothetical protein NHQ30_006080 [Ciborinia camelliae]